MLLAQIKNQKSKFNIFTFFFFLIYVTNALDAQWEILCANFESFFYLNFLIINNGTLVT